MLIICHNYGKNVYVSLETERNMVEEKNYIESNYTHKLFNTVLIEVTEVF